MLLKPWIISRKVTISANYLNLPKSLLQLLRLFLTWVVLLVFELFLLGLTVLRHGAVGWLARTVTYKSLLLYWSIRFFDLESVKAAFGRRFLALDRSSIPAIRWCWEGSRSSKS
jgi:hypothetical protein